MNSPASKPGRKSRLMGMFPWILSAIVVFMLVIYISFQVSPWPSVLLIRYGFSAEGGGMNDELAKYLPHGIASQLDIPYDPSNKSLSLDLYFQKNATTSCPLIVWVHGGGFVAGDKKELSNYCKVLTSRNLIVAAINYTVAPEAQYPVPVDQLNTALAFLVKNADEYKIDTTKIVVAGDSGGAHITAQLANVYTNPEYATMLAIKPSIDPLNVKGVILYCGPYNTDLVDFEGVYGGFLNTVLWSYIGSRDFFRDPKFVHFSVAKFVTEKFPPAFISVGNEDPLCLHSYDLASKLSTKGAFVDTLFFAKDYSPGLPHEYQFNLDSKAGKLALERTRSFLSKCVSD